MSKAATIAFTLLSVTVTVLVAKGGDPKSSYGFVLTNPWILRFLEIGTGIAFFVTFRDWRRFRQVCWALFEWLVPPPDPRERQSEDAVIRQDFALYCQECAGVVDRARQSIVTVQTPVRYSENSSAHAYWEEPYNRYINATIEKLVTGVQYTRIVILDRDLTDNTPDGPIGRAKSFARSAVQKAWKSRRVDIQAEIGFILSKEAIGLLRSGIDVTVTECNEFSLAFAKNENLFGGSIHVKDRTKFVWHTLNDDIRASWQRIEGQEARIKIANYANQPHGSEDAKDRVLQSMDSKIDEIVRSVRARSPKVQQA